MFKINCTTSSIRPDAKIQNIDYLIEQGKLLWDQRLDSLALNKAEHFINLAYKQRKNDFELSILYSQISFTRAYFFEKNDQIQDSLFLQGSQSCQKAVMSHEDFIPIYIL